MSGREIFKYAVNKMVESAHTALARANLTTHDVDWMVPHQARDHLTARGVRTGGDCTDRGDFV